MGGSSYYERLGLQLDPSLSSVVPDPSQALEEVLALLRAMIRNKCVNYGDGQCEEARNIQTLCDYLDGYGIKYQLHHMPGRPKRLNLIAEYGTGSPRVMLGPGHVDVVPVPSPDGGLTYPNWKAHPFKASVIDDTVYGRGAVDMLNTVAAHAVAFAHLHRSQAALQGTLVFCAVSDEEAGGAEGVGFLLSDPSLSQVFRADFCMTEIGGATLLDRHLRPSKVFIQANSEKGTARVDVVCRGRGGHGSVPLNADSALARAADVVTRLEHYWAPTVVTEEWRSFVWSLDVHWLLRLLLTSRLMLRPIIALLLRLGSPLGPIAHALTRTTLSPNNLLVSGGKANVVPAEVAVELDVRTLPGQGREYIMQQLRAALGNGIMDDKVHYEVVWRSFQAATRSPVDTPLWRAMEAAATTLVPGCSFARPPLPGATDSRFYREKGTCAYGANLFEPALDFGQLMKCFHGDNERISIRSLWQSFQFFTMTILIAMGKLQK